MQIAKDSITQPLTASEHLDRLDEIENRIAYAEMKNVDSGNMIRTRSCAHAYSFCISFRYVATFAHKSKMNVGSHVIGIVGFSYFDSRPHGSSVSPSIEAMFLLPVALFTARRNTQSGLALTYSHTAHEYIF